jgi:hypothetical protein
LALYSRSGIPFITVKSGLNRVKFPLEIPAIAPLNEISDIKIPLNRNGFYPSKLANPMAQAEVDSRGLLSYNVGY